MILRFQRDAYWAPQPLDFCKIKHQLLLDLPWGLRAISGSFEESIDVSISQNQRPPKAYSHRMAPAAASLGEGITGCHWQSQVPRVSWRDQRGQQHRGWHRSPESQGEPWTQHPAGKAPALHCEKAKWGEKEVYSSVCWIFFSP